MRHFIQAITELWNDLKLNWKKYSIGSLVLLLISWIFKVPYETVLTFFMISVCGAALIALVIAAFMLHKRK